MHVRTLRVSVLLCGIALLLGTRGIAYAQDPSPEPGSDQCDGCHEGLRDHWSQSGHANALSDPVFQDGWKEEGYDTSCLSCHTTGYDPLTGTYAVEGVACTVCHSPVVADHPDNYMPTNVSSRLCGDCHLETYADWEQSLHSVEDLQCNQCHNPHTAEVRVADTQALCQTCHKDEAHYYAYTGHAEGNVLCVDCHLSVLPAEMGTGHSKRQHTFEVGLAACNECHMEDMHAASEGVPAVLLESRTECYRVDNDMAATTGGGSAQLLDSPAAANSMSIAGPTTLALVLGLMLYPIVEQLNRRFRPKGALK